MFYSRYFSISQLSICLALMNTFGKEMWIGNGYKLCYFRRIAFTDINTHKPGSVFIIGPIFITLRPDNNYGSNTKRL